jgi:hypothetical protein
MRLEPKWDRTLLGIGDQHWTAAGVTTSNHLNANERAKKYQSRVLGRGTPAGAGGRALPRGVDALVRVDRGGHDGHQRR